MPIRSAAAFFTPPRSLERPADRFRLDPFLILVKVGTRQTIPRGRRHRRHREAPGRDHRFSREHDRPFDRVLELANIARPIVHLQRALSGLLDTVDTLAGTLGTIAPASTATEVTLR